MSKEINMESAIRWAEDYIKEYQKSGDFDPFRELTGTADKKQRLFGECVDFLHALEMATETFRQNRDRITFKEV